MKKILIFAIMLIFAATVYASNYGGPVIEGMSVGLHYNSTTWSVDEKNVYIQ